MGDVRPVDAVLHEVVVKADRVREVGHQQSVVTSVCVNLSNVIAIGEDQPRLDSRIRNTLMPVLLREIALGARALVRPDRIVADVRTRVVLTLVHVAAQLGVLGVHLVARRALASVANRFVYAGLSAHFRLVGSALVDVAAVFVREIPAVVLPVAEQRVVGAESVVAFEGAGRTALPVEGRAIACYDVDLRVRWAGEQEGRQEHAH